MYDPFEVGKTGSRGTRGRIEERFSPEGRAGPNIGHSVSRIGVAETAEATG
jgi:hypothetical protein